MKTEPDDLVDAVKVYVPADGHKRAHDRYIGLTKREAIALAAMQGMLSGKIQKYLQDEKNSILSYDKLTDAACNCADALIKRLNQKFRTKNQMENKIKSLLDYLGSEMSKCEETKDNWVIIKPHGRFYIDEEINVLQQGDCFSLCTSKQRNVEGWLKNQWIENRKHVNMDRYSAFAEIKEKVKELDKAFEQTYDEGYGKGYSDATKEAQQEIAKNYHPNH